MAMDTLIYDNGHADSNGKADWGGPGACHIWRIGKQYGVKVIVPLRGVRA
jgi:hypothetical protein